MGPLTLPTATCLGRLHTSILINSIMSKVTSKLQDTRKSASLRMNSLPTYLLHKFTCRSLPCQQEHVGILPKDNRAVTRFVCACAPERYSE